MKCGSCYLAIHMFMDPALKDRFGPDFIRAVGAQGPAVYADVNVMLDRVIAGEVDIAYWVFESGAIAKWRQGAPIRWVHPKPTPLASTVFQGVSTYAPSPNAARLFQNWTYSQKGQAAYQTLYGSGPLLSGASDTREVNKQDWYDVLTQPYHPNFDRWAQNFDKDMSLWINSIRPK